MPLQEVFLSRGGPGRAACLGPLLQISPTALSERWVGSTLAWGPQLRAPHLVLKFRYILYLSEASHPRNCTHSYCYLRNMLRE